MSGGISIAGCASPIELVKKYPHKFGINSSVYVKKKAQNKGILERLIVKKVNRVLSSSPTKAGIKGDFNYIDTFNRVWMEEELVWQPDAVALATAYWENIANLAQAELERIGCA